MRVFESFLIALISTPLSSGAFACSFQSGFEPADLIPVVGEPLGAIPQPPIISVESLKRGFDDGNGGACSDAGILILRVTRREGEDISGFLFKLEKGIFPDDVLPDGFVKPVLLIGGVRGFMFVWLDLPQGRRRLRPIDVVISVRQISSGGQISEPLLLSVSHRGGDA